MSERIPLHEPDGTEEVYRQARTIYARRLGKLLREFVTASGRVDLYAWDLDGITLVALAKEGRVVVVEAAAPDVAQALQETLERLGFRQA